MVTKMTLPALLKKIAGTHSIRDALNGLSFRYRYEHRFNYETEDVNDIVKMLKKMSVLFYHHDKNGILKKWLEGEQYPDLKQVFLIKNIKILCDKYIADIKSNLLFIKIP